MKQSQKKKEISLEEGFAELEALVHEFESGSLDLEKAIPKFKGGIELAKMLKEKLTKLENEIREIVEEKNTSF